MRKLNYIWFLLSIVACTDSSTNTFIQDNSDQLTGEVRVNCNAEEFDITNDDAILVFTIYNNTNQDIYLTKGKHDHSGYSKQVMMLIDNSWISGFNYSSDDTTIIVRPNEFVEDDYWLNWEFQYKVRIPFEFENGQKDTVESRIISVANDNWESLDYNIAQDQNTGELVVSLKNISNQNLRIHYAKFSPCYFSIASFVYMGNSGVKYLFWDSLENEWSYTPIDSTASCAAETYLSLEPNELYLEFIVEEFPEEGRFITEIDFFFDDYSMKTRHLHKVFEYQIIE